MKPYVNSIEDRMYVYNILDEAIKERPATHADEVSHEIKIIVLACDWLVDAFKYESEVRPEEKIDILRKLERVGETLRDIKITQSNKIYPKLSDIEEHTDYIADEIDKGTRKKRSNPSADDVKDHKDFVLDAKYGYEGLCPILGVPVFKDGHGIGHWDHMRTVDDGATDKGWYISKKANGLLRHGKLQRHGGEVEEQFVEYQRRFRRWLKWKYPDLGL